MWKICVIVPEELQQSVLDELHSGHLGVVKIKALARSYVWWPGLDRSIEKIAAGYFECQMISNSSEKARLHP